MTNAALKNILIVEDNRLLRKSLRDFFQLHFPFCRVIEAGTGEEAVEIARSTPLHAVVMDICLPGISGIEATRRIREIEPNTKVALLTICDDDSYRADAKSAGASAYIPKQRLQPRLAMTVESMLLNFPIENEGWR